MPHFVTENQPFRNRSIRAVFQNFGNEFDIDMLMLGQFRNWQIRNDGHMRDCLFHEIDPDPAGLPNPAAAWRNYSAGVLDEEGIATGTEEGVIVVSGALIGARGDTATNPHVPDEWLSLPRTVRLRDSSNFRGGCHLGLPGNTWGDWEVASEAENDRGQWFGSWVNRELRIIVYSFDLSQLYGAASYNVDEMLIAPLQALVEGTALDADAEKALFASYAKSRDTRQIEGLRAEIGSAEHSIALAQANYTSLVADLRERQQRLDIVLALGSKREADKRIDPETEWQKIIDHPKVKEARFRRNRLTILTEALELENPENPDDKVELGEFEIRVPLPEPQVIEGETEPDRERRIGRNAERDLTVRAIRMVNKTGKRESRDHPHITDGIPCWGESGPAVGKMLAYGEIGGLVELLLQYLQTFNPRDDYGRYAGLFFGEGRVFDSRNETQDAMEERVATS